MKRNKKILIFILCVFLTLFFCIYGKEISVSLQKAVDICLYTIIPSMLPLTVISLIIIKLDLINLLGRRFAFFMLLLLSFFAGYPLGAKLLDEAVQEDIIDKKTAERFLPCFINAGPGFIVNTAGLIVFNNKKIGLLLFLSQIFASFLIFLILRGFKVFVKTKSKVTKLKSAINYSVAQSVNTFKNICVNILLFSALNEILKFLLGKPAEYFMLFGEITTAVLSIKNVYIVSVLLSMCGLCVFFQIISIVKNYKINIIKLISFRALHASISTSMLILMIRIFKISENVFSNTNLQLIINKSSSFTYIIFVILLLVSFLYSIMKKSSGNIIKDLL